jgi:hypothetical protein
MKKHFFSGLVSWFSRLTDGQKLVGIVSAILLFSLLYWGLNGDGGITGFQVLARQKGGFWLGLIISVIAIGVLVYFMIRHYSKTQDGSSTTAFLIAIAIFMGIAFGKGCTDKANGGTTAGKGRPSTEQTK